MSHALEILGRFAAPGERPVRWERPTHGDGQQAREDGYVGSSGDLVRLPLGYSWWVPARGVMAVTEVK